MPDSYFGAVWPAYYSSGFGQSRDSDDLEQSNFATAIAALGGESETVEIVRESHWAVGWVEWIAIHQDDGDALEIADKLQDRMANYPVLNEEDWSQREWDHAQGNWEQSSLRDKVALCCENGLSKYAARRETIPEEDNGAIFQSLIGC